MERTNIGWFAAAGAVALLLCGVGYWLTRPAGERQTAEVPGTVPSGSGAEQADDPMLRRMGGASHFDSELSAIPPITVQLEKVSGSDLAAALAEQMNLQVTAFSTPMNPTGGRRGRGSGDDVVVSLNADRSSYWEVVTKLSKFDDLALTINGKVVPKPGVFQQQGPMIAQLNSIRYSEFVLPQGDDDLYIGGKPAYVAYILAAIDPRLSLVSCKFTVDSIRNDVGEEMAANPASREIALNAPMTAYPITFYPPSAKAKKATIRGALECQVERGRARTVLFDSRGEVPPISLDGVEIIGTTDGKSPPTLTLTAAASVAGKFPTGVRVSVADNTRAILSTQAVNEPGEVKLAGGTRAGIGPYRLTVTVVSRVETMRFPFEFKDVELP